MIVFVCLICYALVGLVYNIFGLTLINYITKYYHNFNQKSKITDGVAIVTCSALSVRL